MQFFDSHCHLDFPDFDESRDEIRARADEAGVTRILNPGADIASSDRAVELAKKYENIFAAAGIHPHDVRQWSADVRAGFVEKSSHEKVVAIGEIGLDYFRLESDDTTTREVQQKAFWQQLELAQALDLPVIIHTREAEGDTLAILDEFAGISGVVHCYTGSVEMARGILERGFSIGFTGIITFKNAAELREVVALTPLSKILIETDAPYLAPEPHRGRQCEPAFVVEVAKKIAELKNTSLEEVAETTFANANRLFRLPA